MKMSTALLSSVFALALTMGGTSAFAASGTIEKIENEGRKVVVAGTEYSISGSRTKVMVNGAEASRGDLKVGMTCEVEGDGEATSISCK